MLGRSCKTGCQNPQCEESSLSPGDVLLDDELPEDDDDDELEDEPAASCS